MSSVSNDEIVQAETSANSYRIGALLYFRDESGRVLLIQRRKDPNAGRWCAVGGKLEMAAGESPFECATREAAEETGETLAASDLVLRSILAEKDYEQSGHWLMFIFEALKPLTRLPERMEEGQFRFFQVAELPNIDMPPLDRAIFLERLVDGPRDRLHILRAESGTNLDPERLVQEELIGEA